VLLFFSVIRLVHLRQTSLICGYLKQNIQLLD